MVVHEYGESNNNMWTKFREACDAIALEQRLATLEEEHRELQKALVKIQKQFYEHEGNFSIQTRSKDGQRKPYPCND